MRSNRLPSLCLALCAASFQCVKSDFRTADADVSGGRDLGAEASDITQPDTSLDDGPVAPPDAAPDASSDVARADTDADAAASPDADDASIDADAGVGDAPTDVRDEDTSAPPGDGALDGDAPTDGGCPEGRVSVFGRCVVPSGVGFALGGAHSCARGTAGTCGGAYCWGSNHTCALGIRADIDTGVRGCADDGGVDPGGVNCMPLGLHPPTRVSLPGEVRQFAGGNDHTCALIDEPSSPGAVYCWGLNNSAQVGDCSSTNRPSPVRVALPRPAVQVAAGNGHTCALLDDGVPWCWGSNRYGQTGRVGGPQYSPRPIDPPLDDAVSQIALGGQSSCALMRGSGAVVCWGRNDHGEFGRPTSLVESGPNRVPAEGVEDAVQVAVGEYFVCALRRDGRVLCWGGNEECELGTPTAVSPVRRPQLVPGLANVRQISAHYRHACALVGVGGEVWCWGLADYIQTGQRSSATHCVTGRDGGMPVYATTAPTRMSEFPPDAAVAVAVAAGGSHSCALAQNGTLHCWGGNNWAELGGGERGGSSELAVPVRVCPADAGVPDVPGG